MFFFSRRRVLSRRAPFARRPGRFRAGTRGFSASPSTRAVGGVRAAAKAAGGIAAASGRRLFLRWSEADARIQAGFLLLAAFFAMVVLPGAVAATVHQVHSRGPNPVAAWSKSRDAAVKVTVYRVGTRTVVSMPENEYLLGVLAAQVNPHAPLAALKAAAVAARTYAAHAMQAPAGQTALARAHHADVTDNPAVDLPWLPESAWDERFGADAGWVKARLEQAILGTDGIILEYRRQPIMAFITTITNGWTRSASGSLKKTAPYLRAVACPADRAAERTSTTSVSRARLARALGETAVNLAGVRVAERDAQGYVVRVEADGRTWTGESFAAALGLASPCFTLRVDKSGLRVTVHGEGPGFGLSLHQASAFAEQGRDWQWILEKFYPGSKPVRV
ncbi:SpoIID/LytB domain-containing protein [Alicyclobacillus kakegawensis]|uniref:SpoIID/LytB domain-containing protein n=1 Tax=Alicyclobacillus kakegawensis TaxID=392012 RepID=UPI0009F81854|nr:SpoIID/LytB domain-containing protein [Alicyclobacillus kakegawensis]